MKLSKEKRDQFVLVCTTTLMLSSAIVFGLINTRKQQMAVAVKKLEGARTRVLNAERVLKRAEETEGELAAATGRLQTNEASMALAADLYSWSIQLLDKAKSAHAVEIVDIARPKKGDVMLLPKFPYDAALFSVRGIGHFHDIGKFLADFENQFPYFRVQNLTLGVNAEAGQDVASGRLGKEKLLFTMDVVALIKPNR